MQLNSKTHSAADFSDAQEFCHSRGWTDGLPIGPAHCSGRRSVPRSGRISTRSSHRSRACALATCFSRKDCRQRGHGRHPAGILPGDRGPRPPPCLKEPFLLHGVLASTSGAAVFVVINGPIRKEIAADGTFSALGPGRPRNHCHRSRTSPDRHQRPWRSSRRYRPFDARAPRQDQLLPCRR